VSVGLVLTAHGAPPPPPPKRAPRPHVVCRQTRLP